MTFGSWECVCALPVTETAACVTEIVLREGRSLQLSYVLYVLVKIPRLNAASVSSFRSDKSHIHFTQSPKVESAVSAAALV